MAKKVEAKEIEVQENSAEIFKAFQMNSGDLSEMINENLEGEKISVQDLIKVSREGKEFIFVNAEGEQAEKLFEGVIIYKHHVRSYWETPFDEMAGEITAPECSSEDGIIGVGEPGGECESCPMAQFGTDGSGQACKKNQRLYILMKDDLIPVVMNVPTASLKKAKSYYLSLAQKGVPYYGVVTLFTITKTKNKNGMEYSEVNFAVKKFFEPEEIAASKGYREMFRKIV